MGFCGQRLIDSGGGSIQRWGVTIRGIILAGLPWVAAVLCPGGELPKPLVELPREAWFRPGDDLAWADGGWDAGGWRRIPTGESWNVHGVSGLGGRGWYGWELALPESAAEEWLVVSAGFVGTISEIYLNGQRIGGEGSVESGAFPPLRTLHAAMIPPGVARFGEGAWNVLAVRVRGVGGLSGMLGGPAGVFRAEDAARLKAWKEGTKEVVRIGVGMLCLMWVGVMLLVRVAGLKVPGLAGAAALALMMGGFTLLQSQYFQVGWMPEAPRIFGSWVVLLLFPPSLYLFTRMQCRDGSWWAWDVLVLGSALVFLGLTGRHYEANDALPVAAGYAVHFVVCAVAAMLTAFRTWRAGRGQALSSLLSTAVVAVLGTVDLANLVVPLQPVAAMAVSGSEVSVAVFVMIQGGALILRFVKSQRRETTLRHRLLRAHEDERRRIGHDLHDGLAQTLQGVLARLHLLAREEGLGEVKHGVKQAVREVREIARDLQPVHLRDASLGEALASLAGELNRELDAGLTFECDETVRAVLADLPKRPVEILYRIMQEAVNNALQHSGASRIDVAVRCEGDAVVFTVEDDGCGFDVEAARQRTRMGLAFMADRADLVGGKLTLRSEPGFTRVRLWLPLEAGRELDSRILARA